jgi:hypothetical protein
VVGEGEMVTGRDFVTFAVVVVLWGMMTATAILLLQAAFR